MKDRFIGMGCYYRADVHGLIKTVCRGYHYESGEAMIGYVKVGLGGCASEVLLMPEEKFLKTFARIA